MEGNQAPDVDSGAGSVSGWTEDVHRFPQDGRMDCPHEEEHAECHRECSVIRRRQGSRKQHADDKGREGEKPLVHDRPKALPYPIPAPTHQGENGWDATRPRSRQASTSGGFPKHSYDIINPDRLSGTKS